MRTIAVLGASGFIGSRIVETFHLGKMAEVRPVVRQASSLARLSRFALDWRVADACDAAALTLAFAGCDAVIHAVAGAPAIILEAVEPVYRAAARAGVRRLVYLSSGSVHGQAPAPGTNEASPLDGEQPIAYNNAKVRAEQLLGQLAGQGTTEVVILRPGIVFGPRSYWVGSFADALLAGAAYVIEEGRGVCNSVYVDNLVHAIRLAIEAVGVNGEAFLVGDREPVAWRDLYQPIAAALGFDLSKLPNPTPVLTPESPGTRDRLRNNRALRAIADALPARVRRALSAGLLTPPAPAPLRSAWENLPAPRAQATLEMSLLYTCRYKLPYGKATKLLGYEPAVSFAEGCRRTVGWLAFAGYPVRSEGSSA